MKKFTTYLSSKRNILDRSRSSDGEPAPEGDSPEANIVRSVKIFCESGTSSDGQDQGEEFLQLPVIVEAAESSPAATSLAAHNIRKYISTSNSSKPHVQYNAIMLIRILADNPGPSFTRNIDEKFVSTVKQVLRNSREPRVQQILRETLSSLYRDKAQDENLTALFTMWTKESGMQRAPGPTNGNAGPPPGQQPSAFNIPSPPLQSHGSGSHHRSRRIPEPEELAARIEEAKTSAKLLQQLVQSTPQNELKGNDLITEFADRCQSAQRSMQGYINADNPAADDDTMQTLIETSEQLSLALSKHSRALLQARRAAGAAGTSPTPPLTVGASHHLPSLPAQQGLGLSNQQNLPPQGPYVLPDTNHSKGNDFGTYSPPPLGPPASSVSRRDVPVPEATAPTQAPPISHTYSPPPLPPPSQRKAPVPLANSTPPRPSTADDDPFSDRNASPEDTAAPLPSDAGLAHSGALGRPGYSQVTSSYVRRQDSSEAHYTMHGATIADDSPVSPDHSTGGRYYANSERPSTEEVSPVLRKETIASSK